MNLWHSIPSVLRLLFNFFRVNSTFIFALTLATIGSESSSLAKHQHFDAVKLQQLYKYLITLEQGVDCVWLFQDCSHLSSQWCSRRLLEWITTKNIANKVIRSCVSYNPLGHLQLDITLTSRKLGWYVLTKLYQNVKTFPCLILQTFSVLSYYWHKT